MPTLSDYDGGGEDDEAGTAARLADLAAWQQRNASMRRASRARFDPRYR